ncbi:hypothetical protein [Pseudohongiella nitratireducens]|nr:hypothetical protein [Pseudohongiella nitratireducens]
MARAILIRRQYPWTLIAAMFLFVCSLALAASTLGIIRPAGGDDQGSGMGGTGKNGPFNDSGFGGTGGPSPFLGDSGEEREQEDSDLSDETIDPMGNVPGASWMPRETETAEIPEEMQPLIELQQTPLVDPLKQHNPENGDTLHILDPASDSHLPLYERKQLQTADSGETPVEDSTLEIHLTVPDTDSLPQAEIQRYSLEQLARSEAAQDATKEQEQAEAADDSRRPATDDDSIPVIDAINLANGTDSSDEREQTREQLPERIQRPELPPMQRVRPAVSRPAVTAPRPQPMRI